METGRQEVCLLLKGIPEEELCVRQREHRAGGGRTLLLPRGFADLIEGKVT